MVDITTAQKDTNELYMYLAEIANDIVSKYSKNLDDTVKSLSKNIDTLSNEELRVYMAKISVEAYNLSIDREQTALKEACADALYKEGLAVAFGDSLGTAEVKRNKSVLATMDKQAVSLLYTTVAGLFKTKVDEAHRLASTLSNILISRSAEAKLNYSPRSMGMPPRMQPADQEMPFNNLNNDQF